MGLSNDEDCGVCLYTRVCRVLFAAGRETDNDDRDTTQRRCCLKGAMLESSLPGW
jgi:hypothetical protein